MRIAVLSWRDTGHPDGGGSEVYVESVARELVGRGHEVTVLCARYAGAPVRDHRDGVALRRLGGRLSVYPLALLWLLVHRRQVDVVLDVVNGLPFASPLLRRRGVVALVHHLHREQWHMIYPGWQGRLGWWVESRLTPRVYRRVPFLTVSEATAADLQQVGVDADRITVARNALDVAATPLLDVPESSSPRLCVLARLVPHKRIEHAFEVLARLAPEVPGLTLDVIGDGWWRSELEAAAQRLGVTAQVRLHGHVGSGERDRLLAEAWLMLMPSVKEGWCLAVTEAAAQGTPTIAYTEAGGVRESVVDGRTGVLVDGLDQLTAQTRQLLADGARRRRLGEAARERAVAHTWGDTAEVVERVLRGALGADPQLP